MCIKHFLVSKKFRLSNQILKRFYWVLSKSLWVIWITMIFLIKCTCSLLTFIYMNHTTITYLLYCTFFHFRPLKHLFQSCWYSYTPAERVVWLLLVLNVDRSGTMHNWKKQWLLYDSYRWRWTENMYNVWELWLCYGLVWKIIFICMTQGGSDKTQWKRFRTYLNV